LWRKLTSETALRMMAYYVAQARQPYTLLKCVERNDSCAICTGASNIKRPHTRRVRSATPPMMDQRPWWWARAVTTAGGCPSSGSRSRCVFVWSARKLRYYSASRALSPNESITSADGPRRASDGRKIFKRAKSCSAPPLSMIQNARFLGVMPILCFAPRTAATRIHTKISTLGLSCRSSVVT